jgi:long-chain acyl-CoA synthetase
MLAPIQLGSTVVYMARFSAIGAAKALKEHNLSIIFGVPSMFGAIAHLKGPQPEDFKNVYAMVSGGEPLPTALREGFKQRYGVPLLEGYGLTETSPVIALKYSAGEQGGLGGQTAAGGAGEDR